MIDNIAEDATVRIGFNTRAGGVPITLAGSPAVAVYKDGGTTEITAGVTLSVDFDSRVGYHIVTIDTSADAAYAIGSLYDVVLTAGTVDGESQIGTLLGMFRITATGTQLDSIYLQAAAAKDAAQALPNAAAIRTEMDSNSTKLAHLTGDAYARLGAPAGASVSADIAAKATQASVNDIPTNAEFAAAIDALNQSASRRVVLIAVPQFERPESGSSTYTVEARTFDADGAAVNADSTPTLTATGAVTGSLAANLGSATNPATGVYRWTYTVANNATLEQVRFDFSAAIASSTFTISAYSQTCDFVATTFTTADRAALLDAQQQATDAKVAAENTFDYIPTMADDLGNLSVPSVVQIRQEMDANSTKLAGIIEDTGTTLPAAIDSIEVDGGDPSDWAAAKADIAAAKAAAESANTRIGNPASPSGATLAKMIEDVEAGSGGVTIPVNQVVVPAEQTWVLTSRGTALVGELPIHAYVGDEKLFAVDFRRDLPTNGTLVDLLSVDLVEGEEDGLLFDDDQDTDKWGVDGTQAKLEIEAVTAGTYVVEVRVRYSAAAGGGTAKARVRLLVKD